ncbi:MAG: Gfo/Idh/MocA family protein [Opitutales bacterium]
MAEKSLRAAIIGCGPGGENRGGVHSIAYAHGWAFANRDDIDLFAAASRTEANRDAFLNDFPGTRMYADYREMLEAEQPDLVSVCAFPQDRETMVGAALDAGAKILWCEKPFALSTGAADRLLAAAEAAGARIFLNHQRRFGEVFGFWREAIASGEIGNLESVDIVQPGPGLIDFGIHLIDAAQSILGERKAVQVMAGADWDGGDYKGLKIEKHLLGAIGFDDGVRLSYEAGSAKRAQPILRATGDAGYAELHVGPKAHMASVFRRLNPTGVLNPPADTHFHHGEDGNLFYKRTLAEILDAVGTDRASPIDGKVARTGIEWMAGLIESARTAKRLSFPLEQTDSPLELLQS